jgi:hypothetical protein
VAYGLGFVVVAFGASLLYKGYRGWTWSQFYAAVLQGKGAPAASSSGALLGPPAPATGIHAAQTR